MMKILFVLATLMFFVGCGSDGPIVNPVSEKQSMPQRPTDAASRFHDEETNQEEMPLVEDEPIVNPMPEEQPIVNPMPEEQPIVNPMPEEQPIVNPGIDVAKLPPNLKDLGPCRIGMTLKAGESCSYIAEGEKIIFYVNNENNACRNGHKPPGEHIVFGVKVRINRAHVNFCTDQRIRRDDLFNTRFAAVPIIGEWLIIGVPF